MWPAPSSMAEPRRFFDGIICDACVRIRERVLRIEVDELAGRYQGVSWRLLFVLRGWIPRRAMIFGKAQ